MKIFKLLIFLFISSVFFSVNAQEYVWQSTGGNGDFGLGSNWSPSHPATVNESIWTSGQSAVVDPTLFNFTTQPLISLTTTSQVLFEAGSVFILNGAQTNLDILTGGLEVDGLLFNNASITASNSSTIALTGNTNSTGAFNINNSSLINSGSLTSTSTGSIILDIQSVFSNGNQFSNSGYLQVIGEFDNNHGATTLNLNRVDIGNGSALSRFINAGTYNNGNAVSNAVNLNIFANATVANSGTFTNNGVITNQGSLQNSNSFTNNNSIQNSGSITNNSGGTISNASVIKTSNSGTFVNEGTINNTTNNSSLSIQGSAIFTNAGTLNNNSGMIINEATLNNTTGVINNQATLNNASGGVITNSAAFNNSGILNNLAGATLTNSGSALLTNQSLADIENNGVVNNTASISSGGGLKNNGTLNNYMTLSNNDGGTITNIGTINNASSAQITNQNNGTIFLNEGVINNYGTFNNFSQANFTNDFGSIFNNTSTGVVANQATLFNYGRFINNGSFNSTVDFTNNGSYEGTGTSTGNTFFNKGSLLPGITSGSHFTGVMAIQSALNDSGSLTINLGGRTAPTASLASVYDILVVSGPIVLNSASVLNVNLINAFIPQLGDIFDIVAYNGGETGVFGQLNLPFLSPGLAWELIYNGIGNPFVNGGIYSFYSNSIELAVVTVATPEPMTYLLLGGFLLGIAILQMLRKQHAL